MYQGLLRKVKKYFQTRLFINFLANSPRLEYPVVSVFHGAISPRLINENFVVPSSCLWDFQDPVLVLTGGAWGEGVPPGHMLQDWAPKQQTGNHLKSTSQPVFLSEIAPKHIFSNFSFSRLLQSLKPHACSFWRQF